MNIGQLGLQFAADFLQLLTSLTSNKYVLFIISQESNKINKQTNKSPKWQQVVTKRKTLVSSNLFPRVLSYSSRTLGTRLGFINVKWVVSSGNRSTEKFHGLWVVCAKKCVLNGKSYAAGGNLVTWKAGIKKMTEQCARKFLLHMGFPYYAEVKRDRRLSSKNGNKMDILELRDMCWMEWTGTSNFEALVSKHRLCPISLNWNVITSPSNLLIEQRLYKGWKKCLSCLLFRYWSKKPAYYLVLYIRFLAEVIQTYSFWISQTFLKVCNKSLIFGFRLGQAFRFLLFICQLLACFLQFVFQGFFLFGELQQRKKLCY